MRRALEIREFADPEFSFGNHMIKQCEGVKKLQAKARAEHSFSLFPASSRPVVALQSETTIGFVFQQERSMGEVQAHKRRQKQRKNAKKAAMRQKFGQASSSK